MLTLTENATTIIRRLASAGEDSESAGLRILTLAASDSKLTIELASVPEPGDEVVVAAGARVFLDTVAAPRLSNKELDALISDDRVTFSLRDQS